MQQKVKKGINEENEWLIERHGRKKERNILNRDQYNGQSSVRVILGRDKYERKTNK